MSEEIGEIEKPPAEEFKRGRKLYFVTLIYCERESPAEHLKKFSKYWNQVENQMNDLELRLGKVNKIYHEFILVGGEDGLKAIKELNDKSYQIVRNRLVKGAQLEATEQDTLLAEFMDWTKCLAIGLENEGVFGKIYEFYTEASEREMNISPGR